MAVNGERTRLPCRTELLELVQQASGEQPPADPGHQAGCVHCQAALERIRVTMADVRALASQRAPAPPDLARRVMRRLRAEQPRVAVAASARGRTSVNRAVVVRIAQRAALEVPGVVFASVSAGDAEARGAVRLDVRLVAAYGPALHGVAAAVRGRVAADVAALAGLRLEEVDVRVEDLA